MSTFALVDAFCYVGGHDFTADANDITMNVEGEVLDRTTFRPTTRGWRDKRIGLKTANLAMRGFWQSGDDSVDVEAFTNLGVHDRVTTISAREAEGVGAFMFKHMPAQYQLLGQVGQMAPFGLTGSCSDNVGVIRGQQFKAWGTVAATGVLGTALELGAVGSTQKAYATFHIFGTPGTTITAVLESDDNSNFTSATTRATIGPLTTAGGTWITPVSGAITDTWWRFRVTAITGTFTVAAAAGIQ